MNWVIKFDAASRLCAHEVLTPIIRRNVYGTRRDVELRLRSAEACLAEGAAEPCVTLTIHRGNLVDCGYNPYFHSAAAHQGWFLSVPGLGITEDNVIDLTPAVPIEVTRTRIAHFMADVASLLPPGAQAPAPEVGGWADMPLPPWRPKLKPNPFFSRPLPLP